MLKRLYRHTFVKPRCIFKLKMNILIALCMFQCSPILNLFSISFSPTKGTALMVNRMVWRELLPNSPDQSKSVALVCRFCLNDSVTVLSSSDFHFLCRCPWECGMILVSSVIMAFSTNFISASCVKLNKFNFVIFFKKVTEFILVMFTVVFGGVDSPLTIRIFFLI